MNFQIWERQDAETSPAWGAFQLYRNLGAERSLSKVQQQLGRPKSYRKLLERWSVKHQWVERCRQHDNYYDRIKTEALQQTQREEYIQKFVKAGK